MTDFTNNWPAGLKKTKPRERVLSALEAAESPLSVQELCSKITTEQDPAWPSTVYRILSLFVKKGIVTKLSVMSSETAVYELNRFHYKHYAVCINCHKIIPLERCAIETIFPGLPEREFQVIGHNLEVYGYCKNCMHKG